MSCTRFATVLYFFAPLSSWLLYSAAKPPGQTRDSAGRSQVTQTRERPHHFKGPTSWETVECRPESGGWARRTDPTAPRQATGTEATKRRVCWGVSTVTRRAEDSEWSGVTGWTHFEITRGGDWQSELFESVLVWLQVTLNHKSKRLIASEAKTQV